MSSKEPGPVAQRILRALPDRLNLAIQRRLWPDGFYLEGLSEASRKQAHSEFWSSLGDMNGEIHCPTYGPPFDPPWIVFPDIPGWPSTGFNMGAGEDYMSQFCDWYRTADEAEIADFRARSIEPENYKGFLDYFHEALRKPKPKTKTKSESGPES